jgi:Tfp pilus assembly protein PilP
MRLAKLSRTLLLLALPAGLATCAFAQEHPNVQPSTVRDRVNQPSTEPMTAPAIEPINEASSSPIPDPPAGVSQPQTTVPAPATPKHAPTKASAPGSKPTPATGNAKPKAMSPTPATKAPAAKGAAKATPEKSAKPPVEKTAEEKAPAVRRDPFETLLNKARPGNAPPENLPPGKAGLVVATLRIDGIVRGSNGIIAIVSNPQQRVYFLREGDKLYDGSVQKITLEAISFNEFGKDAFGKPLERQVTKRLYPSPGEQQ